MTEETKKAVFSAEFYWSRPGTILGFGAQPDESAQEHPADFIDAAVNAGVAEIATVTKAQEKAAAKLAADAKADAERLEAERLEAERLAKEAAGTV